LSNLEVLPSKEHWREHRKHPYPSCIVCGKEVRPRSKTCSKECHRKVHYPILSCTFCGKDFERQVTDINRTLKNPRYIHKDHHFCSRSCFAKNSWKEGLWRKPQTL
jgi:predicted nucleic acid-binding Zn ribbon protein